MRRSDVHHPEVDEIIFIPAAYDLDVRIGKRRDVVARHGVGGLGLAVFWCWTGGLDRSADSEEGRDAGCARWIGPGHGAVLGG